MAELAQRAACAVLFLALAALGCQGTSAPRPVADTQILNGAAHPAPPGSRLVLDEQFNGTSLDLSRWGRCHWWATGGCTIGSNHELEWYRAANVSVADGHVRLEARPE